MKRIGLWMGCFLIGCAPKVPVKPPREAATARRIAVGKFQNEAGASVAKEFIRQLSASGVAVTTREQEATWILSGTVTEYKPSQKLIIFLGKSTMLTTLSPSAVPQSNPIMSFNGSQITPKGPTFGEEGAQIISVSAQVGVLARLVKVDSGGLAWSDEYSYEALDAPGAIQAVVQSLVASLRHGMPRPDSSADGHL